MPKRDAEPSDHQLHIRITQAQWERLQKIARARRMTPSEYLRRHIEDTTVRVWT